MKALAADVLGFFLLAGIILLVAWLAVQLGFHVGYDPTNRY